MRHSSNGACCLVAIMVATILVQYHSWRLAAAHLKVIYPEMKPSGDRSSNELRWRDQMIASTLPGYGVVFFFLLWGNGMQWGSFSATHGHHFLCLWLTVPACHQSLIKTYLTAKNDTIFTFYLHIWKKCSEILTTMTLSGPPVSYGIIAMLLVESFTIFQSVLRHSMHSDDKVCARGVSLSVFRSVSQSVSQSNQNNNHTQKDCGFIDAF